MEAGGSAEPRAKSSSPEPDAPRGRPRRAFDAAVDALGRKERTQAELESWLGERDFPPDEIAEAIERLVEAGELDDERFARRYAEDKRELRGWGPQRIREALTSRGLDDALVEAALGTDDRDTQLERAVGLLAERGGRLDADSARNRALGHLTRRGYDYELAYEAIRAYARRAA